MNVKSASDLNGLKTTWFIALFSTAVLIYCFKTVGGGKQLLTTQVADTTSLGRTLALKYCEGCHLFTEPYLLDKSTWVENVLPNMGVIGSKRGRK
ncbi:MAG: hypothetical protein IPP49_20775 [Saprospiraceae bacterium]|nr:hypothetical protein [Saprospiraceae bacterium]